MRRSVIVIVFAVLGIKAYCQYPDSIRLNDVRFLASHNSYKKKPDPRVLKFLRHFSKRLSGELDPIQFDYGHELLSVQLNDYGIRGFELDVNYDPKGGHFRKRRVNAFIHGLKQRSSDTLLREPGFKLVHIQDVDYESNYTTFKQALLEIRAWSLAHPGHTPIFINIEIKKASPGDYSGVLRLLGFRKAIPADSTCLTALDNEILEVFAGTSILFQPEDLRNGATTVKERLEQTGWPSLNSVLGKVIFILDGDINGNYLRALERGEDRPMFLYGEPENASTAFIIRNEPIGNEEAIARLTSVYMVRTRSDAGTLEARRNNYERWNSALASKAQIISTDYYREDPEISDFHVSFAEQLYTPGVGLVLIRR